MFWSPVALKTSISFLALLLCTLAAQSLIRPLPQLPPPAPSGISSLPSPYP